MKNVLFLFGLGLLTFFSCNTKEQKRDIKEFYFPSENMIEEGRVYEYKAMNNDSLPPEYWYYKSVETDSALYFTGTYYDHNFEIRQVFREEIVGNGTLMQDYFLYIPDTTGTLMSLPADIQAPNGFPFEVRDSNGVFLFKLMWTFNEEPLMTTTLIRNRRYKGDKSYSYKNKTLECIQFDLVELLDDFNEGHLERKYTGTELYAKGIGLVYYKKNVDQGFVLEYELVDMYSMDELEMKFKATLDSQ